LPLATKSEELLIREGSEIRHACTINCRPLSDASIPGRDAIVRLLLEQDKEIDLIGTGRVLRRRLPTDRVI